MSLSYSTAAKKNGIDDEMRTASAHGMFGVFLALKYVTSLRFTLLPVIVRSIPVFSFSFWNVISPSPTFAFATLA